MAIAILLGDGKNGLVEPCHYDFHMVLLAFS
jgi:hypothetical protein